MCKCIVLLFLLPIIWGLTDCASTYDQRQTGDLNVQIGLKNIQLIALLKGGTEEYVDYDYAYDYSEMTIKPQHGTTHTPLNFTNTLQSNVTNGSSTSFENVTTTEERINSTEPTIDNTTGFNSNTTVDITTGTINQTAVNFGASKYSSMATTTKVSITDGPTTVFPAHTKGSSVSPTVSSNCRRGFIRNNQGKCEFKVHGTSNALRRIVKLAQKIKIGRGVKEV